MNSVPAAPAWNYICLKAFVAIRVKVIANMKSLVLTRSETLSLQFSFNQKPSGSRSEGAEVKIPNSFVSLGNKP